MSEEKSGKLTSENEIETAEKIYSLIMALIDRQIPPSVYIAGLSVALGKIVGMSSIPAEELETSVYNPIRKAFDITRKELLAMPEVRARLAARYINSNSDTIH